MGDHYQVLYVEDDDQIGQLVSDELDGLDCSVEWCRDGESSLHVFRERSFDLVILDLLLPGLSGLDVCSRIRQVNPFVPIVMLTAKAEMRDVVRGLELGADDYITKPFRTAELFARIKALFRRVEAGRMWKGLVTDDEMIVRGTLVVYPHIRKVTLEGERIELTAKEFDLLHLFARHPGRTFSRGDLLEAVWGAQFEGYDHTVNTHINRLRGKIEPDPANPTFVRTVWGVGYRFAEPEEITET